MDKDKIIFNLYNELDKSGSRGDAIDFIAEVCEAKKANVKGHWFVNREFPLYITDEQKDKIIKHLELVVESQKQSA